MGKKRTKPMTNEQVNKCIPRILESSFWPKEIKAETLYKRHHDNRDGEPDGIEIWIGCETGDIFFDAIKGHSKVSLRFRNISGGTVSPRTHNALKILALAIKLDEEESPQKKKDFSSQLDIEFAK